jgi:predicted PhzF superfamily epimerase YddE/YHI9
VDFVSRFFAPMSGIDEDPVTGSAHCTLAPYWAERLGKAYLVARQISARGGDVGCRVDGDRVILQGSCAFYMEGQIEVPD